MADAIPSRGPQLLGVDILFLTLAVIAVSLRMFVRGRMMKSFGLDDWLMLIAMVLFTLYCTCSMTGIHYGTGRHHSDLAPENVATAKKFWWFCYLFYSTSMIFSKISIGWFLLRITVKRIHNWIIYGAMGLTVLTAVVFFFVTLFQCSPIEFFWTQAIPGTEGRCVNIDIIIGLAYLYSAINVFVDFSFALLPAFLVYGLQLDTRTKSLLIPLLGMGCIASSAVVVRLGYLMRLKDPDFLWATVDVAVWSTVEQGLAITAGSLATLRPLLKKLSYKFGWSKPSTARPSAYNLPGSASGHLGSRQKGSRGTRDAYTLSNITRGAEAEYEAKQPYSPPPPLSTYAPGTEYHASLRANKQLKSPTSTTRTRTESQEELRINGSDERIDSGGILMTRSWMVTEDDEKV